MATFIPSVTDYIPAMQPFKPDYNFYGTILGTLQQRYDQGHEQLSQLYGELLNSPLSKQENIEKRNEYLKKAEESLNKISTLDLSQEHNVRAARKVFEPFTNDSHIMKDMAYTRNFSNQMQKAQSLKGCLNPDDCGGLKYWEEGIAHLQYQMEDFKNSSLDDSLKFNNPRYISDVDVFGEALKWADKAKLNVTYDQVGGAWITKYQNGQMVQAPLLSMFYETLGKNQAIKDKYKVMANVALRNYEQVLGDPELAKVEFANTIAGVFANETDTQNQELSRKKDILEKEEKLLESKHSEGSLIDELFGPAKEKITQEKSAVETHLKENSRLSEAAKRFGITPELAEQQYAKLLMDGDFQKAAGILSNRDAKVEYEANPYGLKDYDFNLWKQKQVIEQQNKIELEGIKSGLRTEELRKQGKIVEDLATAKESSISIQEGGATVSLEPENIAIDLKSKNNTTKLELAEYEEINNKLENEFLNTVYKGLESADKDTKDYAILSLKKLEDTGRDFYDVIKNKEGISDEKDENGIIKDKRFYERLKFYATTDSKGNKTNFNEFITKISATNIPNPFWTNDIKNEYYKNNIIVEGGNKQLETFEKGKKEELRNLKTVNPQTDVEKYENKIFSYLEDYPGVVSREEFNNMVKGLASATTYNWTDPTNSINNSIYERYVESLQNIDITNSKTMNPGQGNYAATKTSFSYNRKNNNEVTTQALDYQKNYLQLASLSDNTKVKITTANGSVKELSKEEGKAMLNLISNELSSNKKTDFSLTSSANEFNAIAENDINRSSLFISGFNSEFIKGLRSNKTTTASKGEVFEEIYGTNFSVEIIKDESLNPSLLKQKSNISLKDVAYRNIDTQIKSEYGGFNIKSQQNGGVVIENVQPIKIYSIENEKLKINYLEDDDLQSTLSAFQVNLGLNSEQTIENQINNIQLFMDEVERQNRKVQLKLNR